MSEKVLLWVGSSLRDMREFPEDARQRAGYQLYRLQLGDDPDDWKPMATVGGGVREIRDPHGRRVSYILRGFVLGGGLCAARVSEDNPANAAARHRSRASEIR